MTLHLCDKLSKRNYLNGVEGNITLIHCVCSAMEYGLFGNIGII